MLVLFLKFTLQLTRAQNNSLAKRSHLNSCGLSYDLSLTKVIQTQENLCDNNFNPYNACQGPYILFVSIC